VARQYPVLGTIVGVRTYADILERKEQTPPEGEDVTFKADADE
jgi:hypothetical protein